MKIHMERIVLSGDTGAEVTLIEEKDFGAGVPALFSDIAAMQQEFLKSVPDVTLLQNTAEQLVNAAQQGTVTG
jgi:hypothetical protein